MEYFFLYNLHNLFLIFCLHKTYVNTEEEDNEIINIKKKMVCLKIIIYSKNNTNNKFIFIYRLRVVLNYINSIQPWYHVHFKQNKRQVKSAGKSLINVIKTTIYI